MTTALSALLPAAIAKNYLAYKHHKPFVLDPTLTETIMRDNIIVALYYILRVFTAASHRISLGAGAN